MEESDRGGGSHLITGRGDRCSYGYVVWMTGESVRPERDHHVGIDFADQLHREPDKAMPVDVGEPAIRIVETSRLGESELFSGRSEFLLTNCSQGGSSRRAGVPDLAGFALGQRYHTDVGAGARVLGEGAADADGLVIGMGEDSQHTQTWLTGSVH